MSQDNRDLVRINTHMTDKIRESLSALYDGQADELEARRALNEAAHDPALADQWQRYSMIGDMLRQQGSGQADIDLSGSIMHKIENKAVEVQPDTTHWSRKWFAQAAVAAGVAFTLLIGLNATQDAATVSPQLAEQTQIQLAPSAAANPLALQASTIARPAEQSPAVQAIQAQLQKEIQAYMIRHAEHAAANGQQGLLPLARVMDNDQESP